MLKPKLLPAHGAHPVSARRTGGRKPGLGATYLVRFDDLCPTMNWDVWSELETMLLEFSVCPILAVVPSNQDPDLKVQPARADFWYEVRKWQERGWTIALHGYQHLALTADAGVVGIARRSEFAGLSAELQEEKLRLALKIFSQEAIRPELWIAPAHSFDAMTLLALRKLGFTILSDGFALRPHRDESGMLWIPQQLWKFRWRPAGTWTVCCHHNSWRSRDLTLFRKALQTYCEQITDLSSVVALASLTHTNLRLIDGLYARVHRGALALRRQFGGVA